MIGQATAPVEPPPRRWIHRLWGIPDIHTRQKWNVVWPMLSVLPSHCLCVLDAGCGSGRWTLELAAQRPGWRLIGLDRDPAAIARACRDASALGLANVEFVVSDFGGFRMPSSFDLVLSVASAHYVRGAEEGLALFQSFRRWLKPEGLLCLLGPRARGRALFAALLPCPKWHDVFSSDDLHLLCEEADLHVDVLRGCIGRAGVLAKQVAWIGTGRSSLLRALLYPAEWAIASLDRTCSGESEPTLMWLLLAKKGAATVGS